MILFTGRYPAALANYVIGVGRWNLRVVAYAFALVTGDYPPFRLAAWPRPQRNDGRLAEHHRVDRG